MSTEFFNDQWRVPSNENQNKISNYSMEFDGVSTTNVNVGNLSAIQGTSTFSMSAWVNLDNTGQQRIFGSWEASVSKRIVGFGIYPGSRLLLQVSDDGVSFDQLLSTSTLTANTWTHVVVTFSNGVANFYINGASAGSDTSTTVTNIYNVSNDYFIGSFQSSTTLPFGGKMDQVSIFDYALPETGTNSVATLYGGGTAITNPMSLSPKPISYYQLGDQSVSTGPTSDYLVPNNSLSDYVFRFDGTNLITAPTTSFGAGDLAVSLWFNQNAGTGYQGMFAGSNYQVSNGNEGFIIYARNTGIEIWYQVASNGFSNIFTLPSVYVLNSWKHICLVREFGVGWTVYLDGVVAGTNTTSGSKSVGLSSPISAIGKNYNSNLFFNGEISNVSTFNTNLLSADVQTLYNNGTPGDISSLNPEGWWKLNDTAIFNSSTSVWTIPDDSSNSNNGTSVGMDSSSLVQSDLQQTSGYSPYALSLDGANDYLNSGSASYLNGLSEFSISCWINLTTAANNKTIISDWFYNAGVLGHFALQSSNTAGSNYGLSLFIKQPTDSGVNSGQISAVLSENTWHNIVYSYNSGTITCYVDGSSVSVTVIGTIPTTLTSQDGSLNIGKFGGVLTRYWNGELSNIALWNTELTQANATEIYNSGVPSNLNTFSGTKPIIWYQLGSNSSFNTNWTCLNEGSVVGSNAVSAGGMTNDDITNGVGYSANGLGSSTIDIVGDAPYSTANGLSENMDVLDRTIDVPG